MFALFEVVGAEAAGAVTFLEENPGSVSTVG